MRTAGRIRNKGIFFTLAIVLLMVPLALLVAYYSNSEKSRIEDETAKIRCDELHYFVEDVKRDLNRAVIIFGRRAAIYAIDYTVRPPGNPLVNYSFGCSSACNIDCNRTDYPKKGSEAAIAELGLCGTLNGTNVTYMMNHTIREWVNRIEMRGAEKNFRVDLTVNRIAVVPTDPWDFSIILDSDMDIKDDTGICFFQGLSVKTVANTSIIGLEDPLYTLSTGGNIIKYIYNCEPELDLDRVAGCSLLDRGNGNGMGKIIFYSDIESDLSTYCTDNRGYVNDKIIVFNKAFGGCNQVEESCFNSSSEFHFAGFIDYAKNDPNSFSEKCGFSIPWISATGCMDNESSYGLARNESCDDANITEGDCVYIENEPAPADIHKVKLGTDYVNLNVSCYATSNSSLYTGGCTANHSDGPSFFDRLDGSYNLSEKYRNQSMEYFNNSFIGIETIVDLIELGDHNLDIYKNASSMDYLYWKNVSGDRVCGVCDTLLPLRMDCQHSKRYSVRTGC